jgi:hypothetical protein
VFHPTAGYRLKLKGTAPTAQVLSVVAQALVPDTVLYEVHAQATPYSDTLSPIGSLVLRSPCYTYEPTSIPSPWSSGRWS